jgi:tetratricopeptide (TPR) repeat protein
MDMCSDSMRPAGGIISQVTNMTSAVFSPSDFNFWVADGLAPVCNNPYLGFNLMNELADAPADAPAEAPPQTLPPNEYVETRNYQALRKYYEAMVSASVPPTDMDSALARLDEAIALCPDEAIYRRLAAKLLLSQWDAAAASEHLMKALECVQSPNERAQTLLLLGFSEDLQGNRDAALKLYVQVLKSGAASGDNILPAVNRFVLADAEKYSRIPYTLNDTKHLEVNFEIVAKYDL